MSTELQTYNTLLRHIKQRVAQAQQRAIYSANEEMLRMYWDIGEMLTNSQMADGWGQKTLERLSVDLKNEFPAIKGFSVRNMQCMMQFFNEYNSELTMVKKVENPITQSAIAQLNKNAETDNYTITQSSIAQLPTYNFELPIKHLSWTHNIVLIQKIKDIRARYWYMVQCIKSNWKVDYLKEVISRDVYGKHGALANNFSETLPSNEAHEVTSMLKEPDIFDMLTFTEEYNERDVEIGLVKHVEQFLVEMGAGFGFMGRQYHIEVSGDDYYIEDVICDNSNPEIVEPRLAERCLFHKVQLSRFESNSAGGRVAKSVQAAIKERGGITKITTKYTTQNKETRIIMASPFVKAHFLFKDDPVIKEDKEYRRFFNFLCTYTMAGRNKWDDCADAISMLANFVQNLRDSQVEIMRRPW